MGKIDLRQQHSGTYRGFARLDIVGNKDDALSVCGGCRMSSGSGATRSAEDECDPETRRGDKDEGENNDEVIEACTEWRRQCQFV